MTLLLGLAGLALLAVVVATLVFDRNSIGRRHHGGTPPVTSALTGVGSLADTHGDTARAATDGNPGTDWYTQTYATPEFGNLKQGLGLVVDAGHAVKLGTLTVNTPTPGFTAQIKAGSSQNGPFTDDSPPETVGATTTFHLTGATARYYVVWITRLPGGGKAEISEVTSR